MDGVLCCLLFPLRRRRRRLGLRSSWNRCTSRREHSPPARETSRKFHDDVWDHAPPYLSRRELLRSEPPLNPWGSSRVYLKLKLKEYACTRAHFFPFSLFLRDFMSYSPNGFADLNGANSTPKWSKFHAKMEQIPRQNMEQILTYAP